MAERSADREPSLRNGDSPSAEVSAVARAERYRLAWLSARRRAGEAAYEVDVWRRLAKGGPVNEEDEKA